MHYIDVVIDNKSNNTDSFFTYSAPDEVGVGARITVPFARRKKPVDAYCVRINPAPSFDVSRIREIASYIPERSLTPEMTETAIWMRRRYGVKYIDALKMFAVGGKKEPAPKPHRIDASDPGYTLSDEQQKAADKICGSVRKREFGAFLIKGVTSSGKTEVYMRTAEEVLSQGRSVIVLLPEIALAEQVKQRFARRFGDEMVATLHSRLSTSAKLGEWLRIRRGEARIVVGARTSVFAPLQDIGAIIIDEEHESTYKSDHNPKYETVDIAYKRASAHNAVLVMGSATPSVASYNRAKNGVYQLIRMDHRIGGSSLPEIETIDMREELRSGNTGVISRKLASETDKALKRGEQVILFLNRRGFSTQILCPDCGYRMTCPDCGISLTYHKAFNAAVCHYCGRRFQLPDKCPDCGNRFIRYTGAGTEKVEEAVKELWPDARVSRFDLDTASRTDDAGSVIDDFQEGRTDILVGTQILAKGLDFRNVGLVGIINADVSLNIPDYRSSERTYQLITQVAGRAGRAGGKSLVLIQTYEPGSDVITEAARGDYESFFQSELLHRNIMNYPPFSDIIAVGFISEDADEAMNYAESFRKRLLGLEGIPQDAEILRARLDERRTDGKYRAEFIIKAPPGSRAGFVSEYMEFRDKMTETRSDVFIDIDINPY